jgi:hypothetical protein
MDAATNASAVTGSAGATASSGAPDPVTAVERPGSLPTRAESAAAAKDRTLTSPAAVERARAALGEITEPLSVGEHTAAKLQAERLVTHLFECNLAGYNGWRWAVTMARPPRSRTATVCELELLPGEDALLAPAWVPWADRIRPGDVTRSDRLPKRETDERLEPGWEATGEEGDAVALDELDLGRARVLSSEGIQRAAQRWYDGDHGPDADGVRKAHAACSTCGFFLPIAGLMRHLFGICANEWAADDGRVVSLDHGCGAHSETDLQDQGPEWPVTPSRLDERLMEPLGADGASNRGPHDRTGGPADGAGVEKDAGETSKDVEEPEKRRRTRGRRSEEESAGNGRRRTRRSRPGAPASANPVGQSAPAVGDEPRKTADAEKRRAKSADEAGEGPASTPEDTEFAREPARGSSTRRASGSRRSEDEHALERDQKDEQPEGERAPVEGSVDRAAAARDAVADLKARPRSHSDAHEAAGLTALAELEASLPRRGD